MRRSAVGILPPAERKKEKRLEIALSENFFGKALDKPLFFWYNIKAMKGNASVLE